MTNFAHLHLHTAYSLKDGMNKIGPLIEHAKEMDLYALAITDHGNVFGIAEFAQKAKAKGMKYIIGCEIYIIPSGIKDKSRDNRHLVLLAKNDVGYKNLITLATLASLEGYYYNPRIDHDLLVKHHEGLIALSACLGGDVAKEIQADVSDDRYHKDWSEGYERGKARALWYKSIFGDDYYLEVQDNGIAEQYLYNDQLYRMAKETGIKLVATNDAHYIRRDQFKHHDAFLALGSGTSIHSEKRKKYDSDEFYLKSREDFERSGRLPVEALDNTVEIANKCQFEMKFGEYKLPEFTDIPKEFESAKQYLRHLAERGIRERYPDWKERWEDELKPRLDYEMSVIDGMGFNAYFLITWDFMRYAREVKDCFPAPGRGSAAGSILAYVLYITNIEPLENGLLFERFLNPSRISMPDIDIDLPDKDRQDVIDYVKNKYGIHNVGQIITFSTLGAKSAIRAAQRALGMDYDFGDRIAKMVPEQVGIELEDAMEVNPSLMAEYTNNELAKELIDTAIAFEGLQVDVSTHAAGVVVAPHALMGNLPLWMNRSKTKSYIVSQFDMTKLEEVGYLKMDFLGLAALSVIDDTIRYIKENHGVEINKLWLASGGGNEPAVYDLISSGDTEGIFQLEGHGMTQTAIKMRPSSFKELTALISLYRPGPMAYIPTYIENKNDPSKIRIPFKELEPILRETYGVLVYQEQVMQMVQAVAGYSMAEADSMRKAIGKKKHTLIAEHKGIFVHGVDAKGEKIVPGGKEKYPIADLERYYEDTLVPFGSYSFNKSHAASYARIGEIHGYLKLHYPVEFMAATIESAFHKTMEKRKGAALKKRYFDYCKSKGIPVENPNVNEGTSEFRPTKRGSIVFGLGSIKGVGAGADLLAKNRERYGPFRDAADFFNRMSAQSGITRSCIEALIIAGALDCLDIKRSEALAAFDNFSSVHKRRAIRKDPGSLDLLTVADIPTLKEFDKATILRNERKVTGTYLSGHPLEAYTSIMKATNTVWFNELESEDSDDEEERMEEERRLRRLDGKRYDGIALVTGISEVLTKKDRKLMAFLDVDDMTGVTRVVMFQRTYAEHKDMIHTGSILQVRGKINFRDGELSILPDFIKPYQAEEMFDPIYLQADSYDLKEILSEVVKVPGKHPIILMNHKFTLALPRKYWVSTTGGVKLIEKFKGHA